MPEKQNKETFTADSKLKNGQAGGNSMYTQTGGI